MKDKATILVVDDEEMNRNLIEAMLIPLGYEVIFAQNGIEALDKVREEYPDVVCTPSEQCGPLSSSS